MGSEKYTIRLRSARKCGVCVEWKFVSQGTPVMKYVGILGGQQDLQSNTDHICSNARSGGLDNDGIGL